MNLKEKLLLTVLVISIFFVIGGIMCTYYTTYTIDLGFVALLGGLVIITIGVIACSRSRSKITK